MKVLFAGLFILFFLSGCGPSRLSYSPQKKYSAGALQQDFLQLKNILTQKHPSMDWYVTKDSLDKVFSSAYLAIKDSMTEAAFAWKILTPYVAAIHCGHTSVLYSKAYTRWAKEKTFSSFPLYVLTWKDSMAVTANLLKNDSIFKRGALLQSINGLSIDSIRKRLFTHLPMDGYAENVNYVRLSGSFPRFYGNEFGLSKNYRIGYTDSASGKLSYADIPVFQIKKDTTGKGNQIKKADSLAKTEKPARLTPIKKRQRYRSFKIDSTRQYAVMTLNSFTKGNIRSFFRRSFRQMRNEQIKNLVIDLRANGGGRVNLSTLLTKYIRRTSFRVADSVFTKDKFLGKYRQNISTGLLIDIALLFSTKKGNDGNYHLRRLERKTYTPKKKNHVDGKVYVLVNGATFSASTVFCNAIKGQPGIKLIGEETGGGWYGNNGIFIPNLKLDNTGLRVRLPLFRLVQYNHIATKGTGVIPDVEVPVRYYNFINKIDGKMEVVKQMILADSSREF